MPALPSSVLTPLRAQFLALIDITELAGTNTHPLGCHRPRIPDTVVFDHLIVALVVGAGYERIADDAVSATTLRRRLDEWIHAGDRRYLSEASMAALNGTNIAALPVAGACVTDGGTSIDTGAAMTA